MAKSRSLGRRKVSGRRSRNPPAKRLQGLRISAPGTGAGTTWQAGKQEKSGLRRSAIKRTGEIRRNRHEPSKDQRQRVNQIRRGRYNYNRLAGNPHAGVCGDQAANRVAILPGVGGYSPRLPDYFINKRYCAKQNSMEGRFGAKMEEWLLRIKLGILLPIVVTTPILSEPFYFCVPIGIVGSNK